MLTFLNGLIFRQKEGNGYRGIQIKINIITAKRPLTAKKYISIYDIYHETSRHNITVYISYQSAV